MSIRYYLKDAPADAVVTIADSSGAQVARIESKGTPGINTVEWDMRKPVPQTAGAPRRRGGCTANGPGVGPAPVPDQFMPLGDYTITLDVAGQRFTQKATIKAMQGWSMGLSPTIIRGKGNPG